MKEYAFGVDIGGTTIKLGLFKTNGTQMDSWEIPTRIEECGRYIMEDIGRAIKKKIDDKGLTLNQVAGIGLGVPGPIGEDGTVYNCVNLGWGVFNVEQKLSSITGIKVKAGNDANVAALGEMWQGGAKGHRNVVMITLGTGVGGGIIIGEKILAGTHGAGGEIGHFPMVDSETETCGCGKQGCLEQYASASGIAKTAGKWLNKRDTPSVLRNMKDISAKEIFDSAKAGDQMSVDLVEFFGEQLGKACAYISCVADPEVFVIGGGVSKAGSIVTDVIEKYYQKYAFHASRNTEFVLAALGNEAGMYGSVRLVLE